MTRWRGGGLAVLVAAVLVCLGCGRGSPIGGEIAPANAANAESEKPMTMKLTQPLIEVRPPPSEPPVAQMVFDAPDGETAVDGLLAARSWNIPPNPQVVRPWDVLHLWPAAAPRDAPARKLRFATDSPPSFVTINAYDGPSSQTEGSPSLDYDCVLSGLSDCMKATADGAIELDKIPPEIMRRTDFVVFAVWTGGDVEVEANWAFSFTDE